MNLRPMERETATQETATQEMATQEMAMQLHLLTIRHLSAHSLQKVFERDLDSGSENLKLTYVTSVVRYAKN